MHPILFRIPLPQMPLKLWWALLAASVIALGYAAMGARQKDRQAVLGSLVMAGLAAGAGFYWRSVTYQATHLPIYSYGVMLGLSLVIGWYLTLTLADRDGLPRETMANCYVITAFAAIVGARVLYIVTNLPEFEDDKHQQLEFAKMLSFRSGGLVAYGGFLGGYLGSWAYLASHRIRLMAWADTVVPSLASGLLVTRIGCYLFGCDFGKRLADGAPGWLRKLGTFPHWAQGTLEHGDGSPAYIRHLEMFRGSALETQLVSSNASFPVHPTQLYESLVGLGLLGLLLWQRKTTRFRGQVFFLFAFAYGFLRFLLETLRDDAERGEYGPSLAEHVMVPGCLLLMSIGFVFGISLGIPNLQARLVARVMAFIPPVVAYVMLKPPSFGQSFNVQLSTSQGIGVVSALLVSFFYAKMWEEGRRHPALAMALGDGVEASSDKEVESTEEGGQAEEADDKDEDEAVVVEGSGKKKGLKKREAKADGTENP